MQMSPLSKMTVAILDDLDYIVDPSAVNVKTEYADVPACLKTLSDAWYVASTLDDSESFCRRPSPT